MRMATHRLNQRQTRWRILSIAFFLVLVACAPAQELVPVGGRLTTLTGEGPPPGYIGGNIPDRYRGLRNPFTLEDQAALAAGRRVYLEGVGKLSCVVCHGEDGRGNGPRALYMDPRPADFAAPPMQEAFRQHQDYVFWWVSEGVPRTVMPAFEDVLSETERWQAITYAWYLGEQASKSASGPYAAECTVRLPRDRRGPNTSRFDYYVQFPVNAENLN